MRISGGISEGKRGRSLLVLLVLALIWGSSYILIKYGMHGANGKSTFAFDQVGASRLFLAFLVLLPGAIKHFGTTPKKYILPIVGVGFFGNGIPAFLFAAAERTVDSALVGMLNTLVTLFAIIIGWLVYKKGVSRIQIMGILVGTIGSFLLLQVAGVSINQGAIGIVHAVCGSMCYAISLNLIRYELTDVSSMAITSLSFLSTGPLCGVYLFGFTDFASRASNFGDNGFSLLCIMLLGIFGTALAVLWFNYLIKISSHIFAASVTYIIPLIALCWGLVDGESIALTQMLGMGVVLIGVYLLAEPSNKR